jgi:hypothetical protein
MLDYMTATHTSTEIEKMDGWVGSRSGLDTMMRKNYTHTGD